jgi:rare lipoprotein A
MKYIVRGVLILMGFIFVSVLMTSCAPKNLTKNTPRDRYGTDYDKIDDEFNYDEIENGRDESSDRQKAYRDRKDTYDPNIRSRYSKREDKLDDSVKDTSGKFYQKGYASWYGREFNGRVTASGERFSMNELTAAHRTLPFGTIVLVKNMDNGRTVKVRINDRGPYSDGRIIDLSYAAAKDLEMLKSGTAYVGIKILGKNDKRNDIEPVAGEDEMKGFDEERDTDSYRSAERDYGSFSLQAGAFYSKRNAVNLKKRLEQMFDNPVIVIRDGYFYKVRIENIRDKRSAYRYKRLLKDEQISSYILNNTE